MAKTRLLSIVVQRKFKISQLLEILHLSFHKFIEDQGNTVLISWLLSVLIKDNNELLEASLTKLVKNGGKSCDVAVNKGQILESACLFSQATPPIDLSFALLILLTLER